MKERRARHGTPSFPIPETRPSRAARVHMKLRRKTMVSKAKPALIAAIAALGIASPATAESQSYPWCIQGGTYRCWYMTREQCEEAVNYHGFCVINPDVARRYGEEVGR
jgi:hypothetical protein